MRFLVIGSGIAGLSFALRVADLGEVVVVTKKGIADSATNLAQGGIAAVLDHENDSVDAHIIDTLKAGAGLCDYKIVEEVVSSGYARVHDLITYGVDFVRNSDDYSLSLGREGGHSHRRVAHAYDLTGRAIEMTLLDQVKSCPSITLLEDHMVADLMLLSDGGNIWCGGALVIDNEDRITSFEAQQTVLCTGGTGKVYLYTSNPDIATGDGIASACRAGAKIANMEFVQFHPTCLFHPQAKNFLISEAVRGEGALLHTRKGERFMNKYDDRLELATRDMVARSIDQEMKESGDECVFLDISHKDPAFIQARFPAIYKQCLRYGIDITTEPIPVVPAAHYLCGGVLVDDYCNSSIAGLMAIGETACTGLHGANRLASNSLLEAVVFAEKAASYCRQNLDTIKQRRQGRAPTGISTPPSKELDEHILINHNWDVLRRTMWNYVGIVRNSKRLELARERIISITREIETLYTSHRITRNMVELRNIAQVSLLIVESAMLRKESRGLHYTTDYPNSNEDQLHWIVLSQDQNVSSWEFSVEYRNFSQEG
ncbi:MAG: L-aspartate oxidase [Desulfofustis sp.]|nr:L-aspartate oxidase [Desulfofustis sp.]NNK15261.1 L-aspartate oxidase [Desulfofustis sp.]NNK56587.1 L-aspartate oxidase [Desulfofustis sp.]